MSSDESGAAPAAKRARDEPSAHSPDAEPPRAKRAWKPRTVFSPGAGAGEFVDDAPKPRKPRARRLGEGGEAGASANKWDLAVRKVAGLVARVRHDRHMIRTYDAAAWGSGASKARPEAELSRARARVRATCLATRRAPVSYTHLTLPTTPYV